MDLSSLLLMIKSCRQEGSAQHSVRFLNRRPLQSSEVQQKLVVQLLHMSHPVGFSLSRPARAARTPFFPYCSSPYSSAHICNLKHSALCQRGGHMRPELLRPKVQHAQQHACIWQTLFHTRLLHSATPNAAHPLSDVCPTAWRGDHQDVPPKVRLSSCCA
jgi:hypothetical protein